MNKFLNVSWSLTLVAFVCLVVFVMAGLIKDTWFKPQNPELDYTDYADPINATASIFYSNVRITIVSNGVVMDSHKTKIYNGNACYNSGCTVISFRTIEGKQVYWSGDYKIENLDE